MYLRYRRGIEEAERLLLLAIPFYLANLLIPPIILILYQANILELTAYTLICLAATLSLLVLRRTLEEYSLDLFVRLSKFVGLAGLLAGFVLGGILVLKARRIVAKFSTKTYRGGVPRAKKG